jgi:hypothetical protein
MDNKTHPSFQRNLRILAITLLAGGVLAVSAGLLLNRLGYETLAWLAFMVFGLNVASAVILSFWRLHHVICPDCGGQTRTVKDETNREWRSICDRCRVNWNLDTPLD